MANMKRSTGNPIADNNKSLRDNSYSTYKNFNKIYLGGVKIKDLVNNHGLKYENLKVFLPQKKEH